MRMRMPMSLSIVRMAMRIWHTISVQNLDHNEIHKYTRHSGNEHRIWLDIARGNESFDGFNHKYNGDDNQECNAHQSSNNLSSVPTERHLLISRVQTDSHRKHRHHESNHVGSQMSTISKNGDRIRNITTDHLSCDKNYRKAHYCHQLFHSLIILLLVFSHEIGL